MTTTNQPVAIPLGDLGVSDTTRRDQWGRYLVVPPAGGKPQGYTRVTTVAKTLDNDGSLAEWKATMTVVGLMLRPGLRAQWEALIAQHDGDPWYADDETAKKDCKRLVKQCSAVGGANDRSEQGTSLHTLTALIDVGRPPTHVSEETQKDLDAYVTGLAEHGIEVVDGMVEVCCVLDDWKVAGTFDRLVTVPGFDLPLIADLKTGNSLSYSWNSIAVQLAAYSRANAMYRQGHAGDGSEDIRAPMPEVDQEFGLVMWLNVGSNVLELHLVDLTVGWEAFEHSMWTRNWRDMPVNVPLDDLKPGQRPVTDQTDLTPLLEASLAAVGHTESGAPQFPHSMKDVQDVWNSPLANTNPDLIVVDQSTGEVVEHEGGWADLPLPFNGEPEAEVSNEGTVVETFTVMLRTWLQDRIDRIGEHPQARVLFGKGFQRLQVPTLRSSDEHSSEDLARIEQLLDEIEALHDELPLPGARPTPGSADDLVSHVFPGTQPQAEGTATP